MPAKSVLSATWDVPAVLRQRVGERVGRQRAMEAEGHLLLLLHRPPKPGEAERQARLFWRKPDGAWQSNDLGTGPGALARHLGEFEELVERFDRQEDEAQTAKDQFAVLAAVTPLARTARNLHAALQQARELVPAERELVNFRDRAYEIERSADLLAADVRHAMEFAVARQAEEQTAASLRMARSSHRLNMLVAFFFPIATLATLFGANLDHRLESVIPPPLGFVSLVLLGLLLGTALAGYLTTQSREPERSDPQRGL
jgi:hypothetical protein